MMFFNKVVSWLLFVIELVVPSLFFFSKYEKRKLFSVRFLVSLIVIVGFDCLLVYIKDVIMDSITNVDFTLSEFWIAYLFNVTYKILFLILFMCALALCLNVSVRSVVFIACTSFSVNNIAGSLYNIYLAMIKDNPSYVLSSLSDWKNLLVYLFIYAALYVLGWFIVKQYNIGDEGYFNSRMMAILGSIMAIGIIFGGVYMAGELQIMMLYFFVQIAIIFLSIIGLFIQFYFLHLLKIQFRNMQEKHMFDQYQAQYEIAKDSIENVNINAHDLKHQINVILKAINETGRSDVMTDEFNQMIKTVNAVDTIYNTGNAALDIVLTEKSRVCNAKDINLSVIADGTKLDFMSEVDVYSLFGNALDNAIEATERIEDPEERIISFSLRQVYGVLSLHVENTFIGKADFVNGVPETTKKDKNMHGFGTKSMMLIANKYGGSIKMRTDKGIFYLDAILTA